MAQWTASQLSYCSNVHSGESLQAVCDNIRHYLAAVRAGRGLSSLNAGLWLSRQAADELASPAALQDFAALLQSQGIALCSLNGFPYGNFHQSVVKQAVYRPHWGEQARLAYSLQLAQILAFCMPKDCSEGTISTLPLGFGPDWSAVEQQRAEDHLCQLMLGLAELEQISGRRVRFCLEMEPGCVLECTPQLIGFFTQALPAAMARHGVASDYLDRYLGVCYDICHQAVMFEDIEHSLASIVEAGINIGKIQVSSALRVLDASKAQAQLAQYAEPRYLHQLSARVETGVVHTGLDLIASLNQQAPLPQHAEWRVHYHVPIQAEQLASPLLTTTREAIEQCCRFLAAQPQLKPHLEVETYTWQVLPEALRPTGPQQLVASLVTELDWLESTLAGVGLIDSER